MTTPHTSGAADLPDATASLIERLEDAVYEWGNYVDADHAPCPLTRHVDPHIKAIRAELERLHALAAAQAVAPATMPADYPPLPEPSATALGDEYEAFDKNGRAMGTAYESIPLFNTEKMRAYVDADRAPRPAPPAIDDPGPFLDDEGRAMVGTSHHYTADNIRALVAEYKALESGAPEAVERYSNSDHRTRAGVLWRVISALADEVPFAPAMDGGDAAHDHIRTLIAQHAGILEQNESAYFELCYHRATGWMAWITDKPLCMPPVLNPDRKVLAQGQGDTAEEACADAARTAQKEAAP